MTTYVIQRVLLLLLTLVIVCWLAFSALRIMPGSAAEAMVGTNGYAEDTNALREKLGLNDPYYVQFWDWSRHLLVGDLGKSLYSGDSITSEFRRRLPTTALLGTLTLFFAWSTGVPLGILTAIKQGTPIDEASRTISVLFMAVPSFWLATMFLVFSAIWFGYSPPLRFASLTADPVLHLKILFWPAVIAALPISASVARVTRTLMLEVIRQDYMRTARAKGLAQQAILFRHGLKNAAPPLITIMGIQLATVVSGAVIVEQVFAIPGMGRYTIEAATRRDYPVVQAMLLLSATVLLVLNLVVDLLYGYLDPRIRLTR